MPGTLRGQVAIVTGAGRGIGRAVGQLFFREGAAVVLVDRGGGAAAAAAQELRAEGGEAEAFPCDVSSSQAVNALMAFTESRFGRLDILVNNAAITTYFRLMELTDDAWAETIAVNLTGVFYCTRAAVPLMIRSGGGRIVNISTMGVRYGASAGSHYAASKGGVVAFTKTAAKELGEHGILVNCIAPPLTATATGERLFEFRDRSEVLRNLPLGRLALPEEVAELVLWVASPKNTYLTGETVWLSGGR